MTIALTDVSNTRFNDPDLPPFRLRFGLRLRRRSPQAAHIPIMTLRLWRSVPQRPRLPQHGVDRAAHDADLRERALQDSHAAARGDNERDEDNVLLRHAMIKEDADCHERRGPGADLSVEEEHERVLREVSLSDAVWKHEVE